MNGREIAGTGPGCHVLPVYGLGVLLAFCCFGCRSSLSATANRYRLASGCEKMAVATQLALGIEKAKMSEADVLALLGKPYSRSESMLAYDAGDNRTLLVCLDKGGFVKRALVAVPDHGPLQLPLEGSDFAIDLPVDMKHDIDADISERLREQ